MNGRDIQQYSLNKLFILVYTLGIEMTIVMNQKLVKSYIKGLEDKLIKRVKPINKKVTIDDLLEIIYQILPARPGSPPRINEAIQIIQKNQQTIVENQAQIEYLKKKQIIEDELTASFIKAILKQKNKPFMESQSKIIIKRQNNLSLNLPSLSRYDSTRLDSRMSRRLDESIVQKSPCTSISKKQDESTFSKYDSCATQRSKVSPCRIQNSQSVHQIQPDQKEKVRALNKLRKLQKFVFQKQNVHKEKSLGKIWNCGVSPTKLRYKQQNQNLKVIQSNLVTHLSLLQKFRQIPSIEGLVARQQVLKRKERQLKDLSQTLQKKQLQLNKRHSDFLKKQKSQKIL